MKQVLFLIEPLDLFKKKKKKKKRGKGWTFRNILLLFFRTMRWCVAQWVLSLKINFLSYLILGVLGISQRNWEWFPEKDQKFS